MLNWEAGKSWHDKLKWDVKIKGTIEKKTAKYFLNNTVFIKSGSPPELEWYGKIAGLENDDQ